MAGDGPHLRGARRQAERDRSRRDQPRDRGRRREEGRVADPDGALHPGGRPDRLQGLPRELRGADPQDPRELADRGRLPGNQRHADQPRRARHRRLGPATDGRPGHDRRHRLDRLPGRVGPGNARPAADPRRVEGDDDVVDLRPPDHPGRRVGLLPAADRPAARRRGRLLRERRDRAGDRGERRLDRARRLRLGPAAGRRLGHGRSGDLGRRTSGRGSAAGGAGRDLAAQGLPHPRTPLGDPEPARRPRQGRSRARAREPEPDPGADGPDPGVDPADRCRRRDPARCAAADARRLLRDDQLPDRASLLPPAARLAARDDRDRHAPQAARQRGEAEPPGQADRGARVRALPPEGLPRPEGVLDRGPRRDRPDDRRAGDAGPQGGR